MPNKAIAKNSTYAVKAQRKRKPVTTHVTLPHLETKNASAGAICADLTVKANPKKIRVPQKESLVKQENDVDLHKVNKIKGWMLMTAGVACFMLPGLPGIPLLLMGASTLWPENGGQKKVKG